MATKVPDLIFPNWRSNYEITLMQMTEYDSKILNSICYDVQDV